MTPTRTERSTTAHRVAVAAISTFGIVATLLATSTPIRDADARSSADTTEASPASTRDGSVFALNPVTADSIDTERVARFATELAEAENQRIAAEQAAAFYGELERQEAERIAAEEAAAASAAAVRAAESSRAMGGGWASLRKCESGGNYSAVSSSGAYRGAYQFARSTWNSVAARSHPHLVGVDPAAASPADQDAMAMALHRSSGSSPWPHCGRHL